MKVCTDACILGAYADAENAQQILDIGTGTGLLSLMLAQRTSAHIDAVEIDTDAYSQAVNNITNSKFSKQIEVYHTSVQTFSRDFSASIKPAYDLIISNPPFYQQSLQSPDVQTNKALHATTLTFEDLTAAVITLLNANGQFVVLLPPFETQQLTDIAQKKALYLSKKLLIQHNSQKTVFRIISTFQKNPVSDYQEDTLVIHETAHQTYTDKFQKLLRDYYIIF